MIDDFQAPASRWRGVGGLLLTVFIGAVLLFALEPMVAKAILPWFGGSAEVWIACLVFFQFALLGGYFYAHVLARWLAPSRQRVVHSLLLIASLAALPILPSPHWQPQGGEDPLIHILLLLTATIGAPYLLLAATSPLLQAWWAQRNGTAAGRVSPYRLYAMSNFGSLLALLSYPVAIEPQVGIAAQGWLWSGLYAGFVIIATATAWLTRGISQNEPMPEPIEPAISHASESWLWFLLAASGSSLLLATTNHISQNVAAIPLFWVVPLCLYLLSFILCFDGARWYRRPLFYVLFPEFIAAMVYGATGNRANSDLRILLPLYLVGLFVACMTCHGELAAMRPKAGRLTSFYLMMALGGAVGGLFVGVLAPGFFNALYEFPVALCGCALLIILVAWRNRPRDQDDPIPHWPLVGALLVWGVVTLYAGYAGYRDLAGDVLAARNFYGALRIVDLAEPGQGAIRRLMHGTIDHGEEFADPQRALEPTTYYSRRSGVGIAIEELAQSGKLKVGVIGLGAGTLAAYGRPGDVYRFYDIDPLVPPIAKTYFSYLRLTPAQWNIVIGDGRLQLAQEPAQDFDLLVVDAFSGDAIPVHLLTREAFALYARHLKPDGVLAIHISNQYLDLAPVVAAGAQILGKARFIENDGDTASDAFPADWVLVTFRLGFFASPTFAAAKIIAIPAGFAVWTDDYSNLWRSRK